MNTVPNTAKLLAAGCPADTAALVRFLRKTGNTAVDSFATLARVIGGFPGFETRLLPFLFQEAVRAPRLFEQQVRVLDQPGFVTLTRRQCLCIMANAFFCAYDRRISRNCTSGPDQPSIHLDGLYTDDGNPDAQAAKLEMLFLYFDRCRERIEAGGDISGKLQFLRRRAWESTADDWLGFGRRLLLPEIHPLRTSLDSAVGMLRIDFANRLIGGGALAYGCVQEEILFSIFPELIVSRLFCPAMDDDEAIVLIGAEQFSRPEGYGLRLRCGGAFHDPTPLDGAGMRQSYFSAIDAIDFRYGGLEKQYSPPCVLRELTKALAGFDVQDAPDLVATGNWGCGAFGGDPALKILVQWAAATRAGKIMHYFPWDNAEISTRFPPLAARLVERNWTVGDLAGFLLGRLKEGDVFRQLER